MTFVKIIQNLKIQKKRNTLELAITLLNQLNHKKKRAKKNQE